MVDAHQGDPALTMDEAAQRMKEVWACENQQKVNAWNVQAQQDRAEQERLEQEAHDAREAQHAQQEKEAEEAKKEADKRKPKLNTINQTWYIGKWISTRPSTYALGKLNSCYNK